jgi:predicted nuclease of predicted toxin-antitoxin system
MKLLFDENLSPKLPRLVEAQFPDSQQLRDCGLKGATDQAIWDYARAHGFILVSKDSDCYQRSLLYGQPPKLVWLRLGNCTRADLLALLLRHEAALHAFETDAAESVLVLS